MPNVQLFDRVVVGCDVKGFSTRSVREQRLIQEALDRMLTGAVSAAGLDREAWEARGDGDGEVAVLPGDTDLLRVVRRFVTELDLLLTDHNEDHSDRVRIRLRVAMASGSVVPGGKLGHGGQALIDLARLLGAPQLRQALADAPQANLAQIVSESLYQRAVVPELDGIRTSQFRPVTVDLPDKGFRQSAYIYVPHFSPPPPPTPASAPTAPPAGGNFFELLVPPAAQGPQRRAGGPAAGKEGSTGTRPTVGKGGAGKEAAGTRPTARPAEYPSVAAALLADARMAMNDGQYRQADVLTTLALLAAADRVDEGCLRTVDAERLPDALFTDLDAIWKSGPTGDWGFAAQRDALAGADRITIHALSAKFGWKNPDGTLPAQYDDLRAGASGKPPLFFPTLCVTDNMTDRGDAWRDRWRMTAVSVHTRLRNWR